MKNTNIFVRISLFIMGFGILFPLFVLGLWAVTERWSWPEIFPQVFSLRATVELVGRGGEMLKLLFSGISISLGVGILSVVISILSARALVFYEFKAKGFFHFLIILPLLIPTTVFAMGIHVIFLRIGLGNTVIGVIISHLIYSLPYAVNLLLAATQGIGSQLEEQALVLGASPLQAFYKISLPLLVPAILSAFSMAYIISFSQYFLTLLLGGGKVKTFTVIMVPYLTSGERNFAAVYSIVFLLISLAIFAGAELISQRISKNYSVDYYA